MNTKQELHDGSFIDMLNPSPKDFNLDNIFRSLIKLSRFGGNSKYRYSVMHHLIACYFESHYRDYDFDTRRLVFCHDFSESTCGDVAKPLKVCCPEYNKIEKLHQDAIFERFSIKGDEDLLHTIDSDMAYYEAKYLMPSKGEYIKQCLGREIPRESEVVEHFIKNPLSDEDCLVYFTMITQYLDIR